MIPEAARIDRYAFGPVMHGTECHVSQIDCGAVNIGNVINRDSSAFALADGISRFHVH
ncbi:MAG: hypothetical protein AB2693_10185 [Candidatus Thiodiazotropha sp.]